MTKDNGAYFAQRSAEELAAAGRATTSAAARVHRELALRYSLKLILPQPASAGDDGPIGQPRLAFARPVLEDVGAPARRRSGT